MLPVFFKTIQALPTETLEHRLNDLANGMAKKGYLVTGSPTNVADRIVVIPFGELPHSGETWPQYTEWVEAAIERWNAI